MAVLQMFMHTVYTRELNTFSLHVRRKVTMESVYVEERCGDIVVEGGVGQIIIAMKTFKQSSGIQTWGAYALCRILYRNSECTDILEYTHHTETAILIVNTGSHFIV